MKTAKQLRQLAARLRKQANLERTVKCAQVVDALAALKHLERRLNS